MEQAVLVRWITFIYTHGQKALNRVDSSYGRTRSSYHVVHRRRPVERSMQTAKLLWFAIATIGRSCPDLARRCHSHGSNTGMISTVEPWLEDSNMTASSQHDRLSIGTARLGPYLAEPGNSIMAITRSRIECLGLIHSHEMRQVRPGYGGSLCDATLTVAKYTLKYRGKKGMTAPHERPIHASLDGKMVVETVLTSSIEVGS